MNNNIVDFINLHRDRYVEELKSYLAIPSISALPQHQPDVRRCAEWTAQELERIGMQNVRLIETPGNPVVYADWLGAPGAPTMLFYGHYDVQPVDPLDLWTSPPFEATVRDGEIYARGSADDKGQIFMHIKAIEAWLKQTGSLPVNIKIFIEGEEEVGSKHLDQFVRDHKEQLTADVVVISDSPMFDRGIPSICYGLRGLAYFQIDIRGTKSDLHSGSFGGAVANPAFVLGQILAQMKDKGGRVEDLRVLRRRAAAAGGRAGTVEAAAVQREAIPQGAGRAEAVWRKRLLDARARVGPADVRGQRPAGRLHRRGRQDGDPRHGDGQDQHAAGARPGSGQGREPVRGVPEEGRAEDGGRDAHAHARRQAVDGRLRQPLRAGGRARHRAGLWQGAGVQPRRRVDPVVSTFQEVLGVPSVLFGIGLPDENAHAPNEKLDLGNFHGGVIASAYLYEELGKLR